MSREDIVLKHINKNDLGIEIGPSISPFAPKKEGFNVHIIDHLSKEGLREKYMDHGISLDKIEEVDFVWSGEKYTDLTGKKNNYKWVTASHVIEHTPDFISFLNDIEELLADDGVLSLVVPDKRYYFDHFRPLTGLGQIIDAKVESRRTHTPGTLVEYPMNVVKKGNNIAWGAGYPGEYEFVHTREQALEWFDFSQTRDEYVDSHAWCFSINSFRIIIEDLYQLGFTRLRELDFSPCFGCEFYITLSREETGPNLKRMDILKEVEKDLIQQ